MKYSRPPIMFAPFKSIFLAMLLALILGPFGLLYSTIVGSLIMLVVTFIFFVISPYTSMGLVYVSWIICLYWTVLSCNAYNKRILSQYGITSIEE